MSLIYSFFIYIYYLAILIASLFNIKAKKWLRGRRHFFSQLSGKLKNEKNIVWVHCASVGEFEQARPLIEYLKANNKEIKILLTFFSPSGYELRKNYEYADFVFYLPLDTPVNARKFVKIVKPKVAIIVKYEFWYNFFIWLQRKHIPYFLVSAVFRDKQYFFKWYGNWFRKQLQAITHIFVQDELSEGLLRSAGISKVSVSGDTRFDRVAEIARKSTPITIIDQFSANSNVIVGGSIWPADELLLSEFINKQGKQYPNLKFILVPHEIKPDAIAGLVKLIKNTDVLLYSGASTADLAKARVLVVDNVGLLSSLYRYGHIAYIGGGFGKGIHNVLEAAVFGLPVIFGPNYNKFREAVDLVVKGGACSITGSGDLTNAFLELLNNDITYANAGKVCADYVTANKGATAKIGTVINHYTRLS